MANGLIGIIRELVTLAGPQVGIWLFKRNA